MTFVTIVNITLLAYFYLFCVIVMRVYISLSDLFVLRVTPNRAIAQLNAEPHYPWYLAVLRHALMMLLIWGFIVRLQITAISFAFAMDIALLSGVVMLTGIIGAFFWHITSYRIDKHFHFVQSKEAQKKHICIVKTHKTLSKESYQMIVQSLVFLSFILLLLGAYIWYQNLA